MTNNETESRKLSVGDLVKVSSVNVPETVDLTTVARIPGMPPRRAVWPALYRINWHYDANGGACGFDWKLRVRKHEAGGMAPVQRWVQKTVAKTYMLVACDSIMTYVSEIPVDKEFFQLLAEDPEVYTHKFLFKKQLIYLNDIHMQHLEKIG